MRDPNHPDEYHCLTQAEKNCLQFWIAHALSKAKTLNRRYTSYGLKHYFQDYGFYLNNGAFKGAMLEAGYPRLDRRGQINWYFNIKKPTRKQMPQDFPRANRGGSRFMYYWSQEDLVTYSHLLEQVILLDGQSLGDFRTTYINSIIEYITRKQSP